MRAKGRRAGPGKILGLLILLALLVFFGYGEWKSLNDPVNAAAKPQLVVVQRGESLNQLARVLVQRHVIRSSLYLRLTAERQHVAGDVKAGTYQLSGAMTTRAVLTHLVQGDVAVRKLTIPEGFDLQQIAARLQAEHIASAQAFLQAAEQFSNPYLPPGAAVRYKLEGYVFPSTYHIPYGTGVDKIVQTLFDTWRQHFTQSMQQMAAQEKLSTNQVMTLASIVAREAKLNQERPVIAALFLNRLHIGMPLQSDPTVSYAMGEHLAEVTIKDEHYSSPYNTYAHKGLPPGPICNPGMASVEAVLHPAQVKYLYMYGLADGHHVFSYTYKQQLAVERKYAHQGG